MVYVEITRNTRACGDGGEKRTNAKGDEGSVGCDGGDYFRNSPICRIMVNGHAGYAARGEDIVCAAASAIIYTAAGALNKLCGAPQDCAKERDGFFELNVPVLKNSDIAYRADIIMETAYIGFMQIEASYPAFLKVLDKCINKTKKTNV